MAIVIVGMLDEREEALALMKETIEARVHEALVADISIGTGAIVSKLQPDVPGAELARLGGSTIEAVTAMPPGDRETVTRIMAEGLTRKVRELYESGRLEGLLAITGMTGATISLPAMKALPFGVPKLLVTSAAAMPAYAGRFAEYFGLRDVTVMHAVVDTVGTNPLVRALARNSAGAICGMVEGYEAVVTTGKPAIAITEFGFCDKGAHHVRELLEDEYDVVSFHATGLGDRAAQDLVGQGLFAAFVDLVPASFAEYMLGGNRASGPDRLQATKDRQIPYILSTCGFDMLSCGPIERRDKGDPLWTERKIAERKLLLQDAMRVQARTTPEELEEIAAAVAGELNQYPRKELVKFVIPRGGFSSVSVPGGILYDPDADEAFVRALKSGLDAEIEVIEVNSDINSEAFARAVVGALRRAKS